MLSKPIEWTLPKAWRVSGVDIYIPQWSDPRYLVWIFQISFFVLMSFQTHLYRPRSYMVLAVAFFTAAITEVTILRWKTGKWVFPQSGLITGSGLALLLESPLLLIYGLAAFVGIASKHLVKYNGRHVFNPNTYGLLFVTSIFPQSAVTYSGQWGAIWWITAIVFILGIVVTQRSKGLDIAFSWLFGFLFFGILRHLFFDTTLEMALGPATGAGFMLFTFYMITDPRTIPSSRKARFVFCMTAAAIDGYFRLIHNHYSMFWAIFITYLIFVVYEEIIYKFNK